MSSFVNAAPMTRFLGTEDLSKRPPLPTPELLPQHLPFIYLYTKTGPLDPQLVVGSGRSLMYGEDSFDMRKEWATHATELSNQVNAQGNAHMIQRLRPLDAGPNASIRLWADVLPMAVTDYKRNIDGSIMVDNAGLPVPSGQTIQGFKLKWVVTAVDEGTFGEATPVPGNMTDPVSQVQSTRYPIQDLVVPHFGADGNRYGLKMWAPTVKSNEPINPTLLEENKVYPIRMACVYRPDDLSTAKTVVTNYAEQYVDVCLKPDTINRKIDKEAFIGDLFIQSYQDLDNPAYPPKFGPFGQVHVYTELLETLLQEFYAAEVPFIDAFSDFDLSVGEFYRFNPLSGVSSAGVPYHSFQLVTDNADSVRLTENSVIYAQGGSDGTMNETLFAQLVSTEVVEFANPNSFLQDTARYPLSIIYDTGFPLETKYDLCSVIAIRKDTAVVLATHTVGEPTLKASEDSSLALALRTRLQMYPESDYFGTPVMRGMIIGRSGKLIGSQYTKRLPLTLEIAAKAAAYMGASSGRWTPGKNFDSAPGSEVTMFTDISATFTPASVRNKDWAAGLNWVQSFGRRSNFFPALKTVYEDDTSVLNSFFTMLACCELQKVGERAWRQFSGVSSLTNAQLIERVNKFVNDNTFGRFDDRFVIEPAAYMTHEDLNNGFSWTLPIKLYAANMKTVMSLYVQALRLDDLAAAA